MCLETQKKILFSFFEDDYILYMNNFTNIKDRFALMDYKLLSYCILENASRYFIYNLFQTATSVSKSLFHFHST